MLNTNKTRKITLQGKKNSSDRINPEHKHSNKQRLNHTCRRWIIHTECNSIQTPEKTYLQNLKVTLEENKKQWSHKTNMVCFLKTTNYPMYIQNSLPKENP